MKPGFSGARRCYGEEGSYGDEDDLDGGGGREDDGGGTTNPGLWPFSHVVFAASMLQLKKLVPGSVSNTLLVRTTPDWRTYINV